MTIKFVKDKETKNTIRFTSTGGDVSGSVYVKKESELAKQEVISVEISQKPEVKA
jgi:hypothetical protein|tara:strand:+ start:316 stop:480 length:165 start_codon:yes stop_codon:yes gene_type:complete